jgi:phthalate 4,5-cis-dihydrodiol dehydrogenase
MCADPEVDAVYIATPNRWHMPHALAALNNKKHVLVEKPMTITLDDADEMIATAERNSVHLAVNVKHSFELRVLKLRELAATEKYGKLRVVNSWRYNNWLYQPRTPEELNPEWGGGLPWRQGPHQLDIIRTIGGGLVRRISGITGTWDPNRVVAGAISAFLEFESGAVATAFNSGYDHLSSGSMVRGMSDRGPLVDPGRYATSRKARAASSVEEDLAAKDANRYGGANRGAAPARPAAPRGGGGEDGGGGGGWVSGGPVICSFDHADVWMSPEGLIVFGDEQQEEIKLKPAFGDGRWGRVNTFYEALLKDEVPPADGRWGKATLELILALYQSTEQRREIFLEHQTATKDQAYQPAVAVA